MSFQDKESGRGVGSRREYVNGKQDPTQTVGSGKFQINTSVSAFQRLINTLGTPNTPEHREKLHKTRLHIGQLVKNTSAKLKQASETDHSIEVSASKKITDVKEFQKAQRLSAERETAYTPFVPQSALPSRSLQMELQTISMILFVVIFILSIGSSSCGEAVYKGKYITQNYFDRYNKLTKREFDNFIANEIPSGLSEIVTDKNNAGSILSGLRRDVIGEGSHRRLSSSIGFKLQHELKYELTAHSCEVIIIERLPNGVFADPFELQHLVERDEFTAASVFGDTNLELPSFRSNQSIVEIHLSFASKVFSRHEDDSEVNLDLPLHARYPPLGHGFSRVEFGQPDIFICCGLDGNVRNRSCLLMPTDHIVDNKASAIIWDVPCGNKEHARVISAVTFGFAIVSAMLIVLASVCCYSGSQGSNNLKLS